MHGSVNQISSSSYQSNKKGVLSRILSPQDSKTWCPTRETKRLCVDSKKLAEFSHLVLVRYDEPKSCPESGQNAVNCHNCAR